MEISCEEFLSMAGYLIMCVLLFKSFSMLLLTKVIHFLVEQVFRYLRHHVSAQMFGLLIQIDTSLSIGFLKSLYVASYVSSFMLDM